MKFNYRVEQQETGLLRTFLRAQGMSKSLLAKVKFAGGELRVNNQIENVLYQVKAGDWVEVVIPDEGEHETLLCDPEPIEVVYEDKHLLIVNKPAGVASIPAQYHPNGTMANRVKNYYCERAYPDRVVHVVTRLDRDTTGLMLFAKHGFAHAKLDQQMRQKKVKKYYQALLTGATKGWAQHGEINFPIGRDLRSLIRRQRDAAGKAARTEYWLEIQTAAWSLAKIQLHTGRTHQIRVHFAESGAPLLGDDLYEGSLTTGMERQALHCSDLSFEHPFSQKMLHFSTPLPRDMQQVLEQVN